MQIDDAAWTVIDALEAERIPWMLAGSYSSNFYGIPRSTHDADFVIHLAGKSVSALAGHLGPQFQLDRQMSFETQTGTTKNVIELTDSEFKIELFRLSADEHDRERFRRRLALDVRGRTVYLPTAEDVVVWKLRWQRRKDLDDVINVIQVQRDALDWAYIESWCDRHETRTALEELRAELDGSIDQENPDPD